MKNKSLRILAIGVPVLLVGIMFYLFSSYRNKKASTEQLKTIPAFTLTTIDGKTFSAEHLAENRHTVLVYFSPSCHYCQAEAAELAKIDAQYPSVQWVWIASEPLKEIRAFAEKYKLAQRQNIHWCYDEKATVYQKFVMTSVPFFLAYDKENQLVLRSKGAIKLEKILESFDENK